MPLQRIISNTLKDDAVTQSKIVDNTVNISKLDVTDGTAGQVLSTDGNGVLSFIDAGSGSGSGSESGSESGSGSGSGNGNVSTGPSTWRQKGSDLNLQGLGEPNMCRLSDTRIAFCDRTTRELKTIEFDGTNWAVVGNQRVINNPNPIGIPVLCRLTSSTGSGSPDTIAFFDHATQDLRTYSFNGSHY
mgnify:CR=1 FL=1